MIFKMFLFRQRMVCVGARYGVCVSVIFIPKHKKVKMWILRAKEILFVK